MDLGTAIRLVRVAKHINHAALARKAKVSTGYISLIENGTRQVGLTTLTRIAEAMEVPLTLIFFLTEQDEVERLNPEVSKGFALTILELLGPLDGTRQGLLELAKRLDADLSADLAKSMQPAKINGK